MSEEDRLNRAEQLRDMDIPVGDRWLYPFEPEEEIDVAEAKTQMGYLAIYIHSWEGNGKCRTLTNDERRNIRDTVSTLFPSSVSLMVRPNEDDLSKEFKNAHLQGVILARDLLSGEAVGDFGVWMELLRDHRELIYAHASNSEIERVWYMANLPQEDLYNLRKYRFSKSILPASNPEAQIRSAKAGLFLIGFNAYFREVQKTTALPAYNPFTLAKIKAERGNDLDRLTEFDMRTITAIQDYQWILTHLEGVLQPAISADPTGHYEMAMHNLTAVIHRNSAMECDWQTEIGDRRSIDLLIKRPFELVSSSIDDRVMPKALKALGKTFGLLWLYCAHSELGLREILGSRLIDPALLDGLIEDRELALQFLKNHGLYDTYIYRDRLYIDNFKEPAPFWKFRELEYDTLIRDKAMKVMKRQLILDLALRILPSLIREEDIPAIDIYNSFDIDQLADSGAGAAHLYLE